MKKIRFFGPFLRGQEQWLNGMAAQGWRLVGVSGASHRFEQAEPGAYRYRIEFVGAHPPKARASHKAFLENMDRTVFERQIGLGLFQRRARLQDLVAADGVTTGAGGGEIFIVEKRDDGEPFGPEADNAGLYGFCRQTHRVYLSSCLLCVAVLLLSLFADWVTLNIRGQVIMGALSLLFLVPTVRYSMVLHRMKKDGLADE